MKTFAGYVRVSHVGGRGGESFHSTEDQAAAVERWAEANGHDVAMLPPELDESGARADRPILLQAVEGVERGEYAGIVVAYLSRASRNLGQMIELFGRVEAAGGRIVAVAEGIDTGGANGAHAEATRNMFGIMAQLERDLHAERFEERRRIATESGIWQRRQTPTGYRRDKATRRLVADRRADAIRATFRDYLAGATILELAKRLRMTPSGVRQLLRNRVYLGELRVGQHVNPVAHPALIDVDTFESVQAKLAHSVRPARSRNGPALLAGLVRCTSCGHVMTRGNSDGRPTYQCPAQHSGKRCPTPASIMAERLDAHVEPIALAELARLEVSASEGDHLQRAQAALAAAERELAAYLGAISAADVGAEAFAAGAHKRRDAVDSAKDEMRAELARRPAMPKVGTGADVWDELKPHERNTLLRSLLAAVVVRRVGRGRTVPVSERARVLAYGADLRLPGGRGGEPRGIVPIPFPDADGVGVLGVPAGQNGPESVGRAV